MRSSRPGTAARIWMVINNLPPRFSGAGANDLRIAPYLVNQGLEISFLTVRSEGESRVSEINGSKVYRLGKRKGLFSTLSWLLGSLVLLMNRSLRPEVIRFRGYCLAFALLTFSCKMLFPGIRIIVQPACLGEDDPDAQYRCKLGRFRRSQMLNADAVFAMNPAIAKIFRSLGFNERHIFAVRNMVDIEKFQKLSDDEKTRRRSELGLPQGTIVLTLGIIDGRKGQARITEAFCQFLANDPAEDVYLIHVGPMAADLERLGRLDRVTDTRMEEERVKRNAETTGCGERVIFAGNQDKPQEYLSVADIFVHCSLYEGEANVVNEAMACGLSVLIPDNKVYEAQVPQDCALRYSENSVEELLGIMRLAIKDKTLRSSLGTNARNHVVETRSPEQVAKHYAGLLKAVA